MTRVSRLTLLCVSAVLGLASASPARAEGAPPSERAAADAHAATPKTGAQVPWHHTFFVWDNAVSTQTLGIGQDYQSSNPTYEMVLRLAPRFYFFDNPARSLSVRGDVRLIREFTNSDTTTQRGEWTFADAEVWLAYVQSLSRKPGNKTDLMVRVPSLLLPTSKNSWMSGRRFGLGAGIGIDHELPLRGEGKVLSSALLRPRAVYVYQFVDSPVATHSGIDRIRIDPDGRALPSDQLSGSALPQHLLNMSLRIDTTVLEKLRVITDFGMQYARRYALPSSVVVNSVDTGPVVAEAPPKPTSWGISTQFSLTTYYQILPYAELGVGYENLSPQLGVDGQRRNFFYSPYSRVFVSFFVTLDEFYHTLRGEKAPEPYHTARSSSPFAL